jgi:glycosyltransferase involved in cell wall biosynthesis
VPKKGIDVLLHALAALRDSGLEFRACVLGKGECLDLHIRLAQKLGLGARVMFPGYVPRVEDYLRSADIFVLPSLHEESGSLALIEALQCGAAVVASAVDGIPEDICHDDNGLLVEPGDAQTLAGALGALLGDESYRRRLAAGGKRLFEERFSSAAFSAALARTYGEAESWVDADGRGANEAYRGVAYP